MFTERRTYTTTSVGRGRSTVFTDLGAKSAITEASGTTVGNWKDEALEKVISLVQMPPNWNGYGAQQIDRHVGMFVIELLQHLVDSDTQVPHIVPSGVGGIQLEWHSVAGDLEIHVVAPYQGDVSFYRAGEMPREFELGPDLTLVKPLVDRFRRARFAAAA